ETMADSCRAGEFLPGTYSILVLASRYFCNCSCVYVHLNQESRDSLNVLPLKLRLVEVDESSLEHLDSLPRGQLYSGTGDALGYVVARIEYCHYVRGTARPASFGQMCSPADAVY